MTDNNVHAERLLMLRKAVATEYGIGDTADWRVRRLALLLSMHAAAEDQSIGGDEVDIGNLLALDKAIEDIRSSLKASEPLDITIHYSQRIRGHCPLCKGVVEDYVAPPKPKPAPVPAIEPPPSLDVAKAVPATIPAPARRSAPVAASSISPMSYGGYDPVRHGDSPLSPGPNPYRRNGGY